MHYEIEIMTPERVYQLETKFKRRGQADATAIDVLAELGKTVEAFAVIHMINPTYPILSREVAMYTNQE